MCFVDIHKFELPSEITTIIGDAEWSPCGFHNKRNSVYKITARNCTYYLKCSSGLKQAELRREKEIIEWIGDTIKIPQVVFYSGEGNTSWLLLTEIKGYNAVYLLQKVDRSYVVKQCAKILNDFHRSSMLKTCRFKRTPEHLVEYAKWRVDSGNIELTSFEQKRRHMGIEGNLNSLLKSGPFTYDEVFIHGDYSLPNILFRGFDFRGLIDLGRAGFSDRYLDLAVFLKSLHYNNILDMDDLFFHEYGLCSVDYEKLEYYRLLSDFF